MPQDTLSLIRDFPVSDCGFSLPPEMSTCVELTRNFYLRVTLAASQLRTDLKQVVDSDTDWIWRGVTTRDLTSPGDVRIRFTIGDGYALSNARVPLTGYVASSLAEEVRCFTPEFLIPRGGRIGIEAQNTNAVSSRTFNLLLLGVKRYYFREVKR